MPLKEKVIGIYIFKNIFNNKVYVGSSIDIIRRFKDHIYHLEHNNHHSILFQRAWNKYGYEYFDFIILEECPELELKSREQYYLNQYKSFNKKFGYNVSLDTTSPGRGRTHDDNIRKKISLALKGHPNYLFYQTESTKKKISASLIGRKLSDKVKNEIKMRMLGNTYGRKTKGRQLSPVRIQQLIDINSKTYPGFISPDGIEYTNITNLSNFCREHSLSISSMNKVANGSYKKHKGWILWH